MADILAAVIADVMALYEDVGEKFEGGYQLHGIRHSSKIGSVSCLGLYLSSGSDSDSPVSITAHWISPKGAMSDLGEIARIETWLPSNLRTFAKVSTTAHNYITQPLHVVLPVPSRIEDGVWGLVLNVDGLPALRLPHFFSL